MMFLMALIAADPPMRTDAHLPKRKSESGGPGKMKGLVFDIQRFSVHDGPGIRTVVFLKGCSLRCFWCQNPEGLHPKPEIMFYPERCIGCRRCLSVCRQGAHVIRDGLHEYLRERCVACAKCTESCFSGALQITGKLMTVNEVMEEVLRDSVFYELSNGGVTLSGGDPVFQHDFSVAILERSKAEGLHTAIETSANCSWKALSKLLPVTDLVIMDIKHLHPTRHLEATGASNERILENARRLAESGKPLIIRVPVIPTVNDEPEEIQAIARLVRAFQNLQYLELLPFHRLGEGKYRALGLDYRASRLEAPPREKMRQLAAQAGECGVEVRVG